MYLDLIFALGHRSLSLLHIPIFTILDLSRQPEEKWTIARVARGCKVLCFREFYGDFETQEDEMESLMVRSQSDFSWLGIDVKEILDQRENIVIATVWHQDVLGALTSESDELSGSLSISHVELLRAHGGTKFQVHRLGRSDLARRSTILRISFVCSEGFGAWSSQEANIQALSRLDMCWEH